MKYTARVTRLALVLAGVATAASAIASNAASAQTCEVRGRASVTDLRVQPAGADAFVVDATDMPMRVAPGDGRRPVVVHVESPLAFEARTEPAHAAFAFARAVDVASGVLSVTPATPVVAARVRGALLDVDVRLEDGVTARVGVACDAVVAGAHTEAPPNAPAAQPGRSWSPTGPKLRVFAQAGGRPAIELTLATRDTFVMHEEAVDRGYVRVRRPFGHGELHGWVRRADLRDAASSPAVGGGSRHDIGGLGMCGTGAGGGDEYLGPATVAAGTEVYFARARGVWARVPADTELLVRHGRGDDWVEIRSVQGLRDREGCADELDRAWVERRSVTFPRRAGRRD